MINSTKLKSGLALESPEWQELVSRSPYLGAFFGNLESFMESAKGIEKLRELILDLAVRGNLINQDTDEFAEELLTDIETCKAKLVASGNLKKSKSRNPIERKILPFMIPANWSLVPLGDIAILETGKRMKGGARSKGVISIGGEHLKPDGSVDYSVPRYVSDSFFASMKTGKVSLDDTLMVKDGATTGKTSFVACLPEGNKAAINEHVFLVRTFSPIDKRFAYFFIRALVKYFVLKKLSGIIGGIKRDVLLDLPIPLPPLAEQKRIVAKVDSLMSLCDKLETQRQAKQEVRKQARRSVLARLTSAPAKSEDSSGETLAGAWRRLSDHFELLLDQPESVPEIRQSILQLAVQGKLVEQDRSYEPIQNKLKLIAADNLNAKNGRPAPSILESNETPFEVPTSWSWVPLGELLEPERSISYGVIKLGREPKTGGVTCLRCSDVRYRVVTFDRARRIEKELSEEYSRTILRGGELLMNIRGTLGGCGIVPPECRGFNIAREIAVIPLSKHINNKFLLDVISSPFIQQATIGSLRGIAYKGLNLGLLRKFTIPLPPKAEQERIVSKVASLMSVCDKLEARLQSRQSSTDSLLASLIHQILESDQ